MKYLLFCALAVLWACNNKTLSESDFTGKTFTAKVKLDSAQSANKLTAGFLAMTRMEYRFMAAGKGTRHVNMGGMVVNDPFIWGVQNDSLVLVSISENQLLRQAYSVQQNTTGLLINDGKNVLKLVKK